jgi:hypothetical protein
VLVLVLVLELVLVLVLVLELELVVGLPAQIDPAGQSSGVLAYVASRARMSLAVPPTPAEAGGTVARAGSSSARKASTLPEPRMLNMTPATPAWAKRVRMVASGEKRC